MMKEGRKEGRKIPNANPSQPPKSFARTSEHPKIVFLEVSGVLTFWTFSYFGRFRVFAFSNVFVVVVVVVVFVIVFVVVVVRRRCSTLGMLPAGDKPETVALVQRRRGTPTATWMARKTGGNGKDQQEGEGCNVLLVVFMKDDVVI